MSNETARAIEQLAVALTLLRGQDKEKVSFTLEEAAESAGVSTWSLNRAIRAGELVSHYPRPLNKPLILARDLTAWIEDGPTENPPSDHGPEPVMKHRLRA